MKINIFSCFYIMRSAKFQVSAGRTWWKFPRFMKNHDFSWILIIFDNSWWFLIIFDEFSCILMKSHENKSCQKSEKTQNLLKFRGALNLDSLKHCPKLEKSIFLRISYENVDKIFFSSKKYFSSQKNVRQKFSYRHNFSGELLRVTGHVIR